MFKDKYEGDYFDILTKKYPSILNNEPQFINEVLTSKNETFIKELEQPFKDEIVKYMISKNIIEPY